MSTTRYGSRGASWSSLDLIKRGARSELATALQKSASSTLHESSDGPVEAEDILTDVSFTSAGDLVARIPDGSLVAMSHGTVYATVHNPEHLLSSRGKEVRRAMMERTTMTANSPIHAPAEHTDCRKAKCIALTFDDGPGPYTDRILDALEKKHAKATFFMLGPGVKADPSVVRRMAVLGMGLGDHSWTHPQFTSLSAAQVTSEITDQADAVRSATGLKPTAVRPPYGAFSKSTPHAGYPFVLWDVDTEDWKNRNAQITTRRALDGAHRGAIVLMHDIGPSTADAVPGIIDGLQKEGYTLVTVGDLIPHMHATGAYYSATKH